MAGGIGRKNDPFRETLAERVATTRARQAGLGHGTSGFHGTPPYASSAWTAPAPPSPGRSAEPASVGSPPASLAEPVRPCYFDSPWGRQPALLLQWRRAADGRYVGLVVVAAPDETGTGWTVIRLWTDASNLSPG